MNLILVYQDIIALRVQDMMLDHAQEELIVVRKD